MSLRRGHLGYIAGDIPEATHEDAKARSLHPSSTPSAPVLGGRGVPTTDAAAEAADAGGVHGGHGRHRALRLVMLDSIEAGHRWSDEEVARAKAYAKEADA